ncbi:hypothetical protein PITCH_A340003 [uncultured Desulfobacterium sp.]|uniref:Uncharacterized protein n=1 Tax=uncultured Desulfobacterium sp. TaxID=201089 RepID=A0A445MZM1_9BACT|nr:hypothetical protein PITCH_A340003 [uncultured Desulfobacterium sp.]
MKLRQLIPVRKTIIRPQHIGGTHTNVRCGKKENVGFMQFGLPLFEELVRSFSRQPEKINQISALVEELKKVESEQPIIPESFLRMWEVFQSAHKKKYAHD